ncbi:patatin-like phospholipase family protein [Clostridium sp. MCC353]|uniref:patatin-like phospholipase family protein n=1 Tax=Clostridium sp. MCC353 TaxID=2592646 RepID=UPI001C023A7A|nr:patatin-like phospholipase family protein [Clostridium sp. MCC353]MBT9775258.1 patatin-like phospholipase family protein [Clostridium sp. MCC353]
MSDKTGLVLGGGGSRGSYELGVWKALIELGIEIHVVTGTSIGAVNGGLVAQGDYQKAAALWEQIETARVINVPVKEEYSLKQKVWQTYQTFAVNFVKNGGTDTKPLKETLGGFIDEEKVRSSAIDYGLVTVEMEGSVPRELFREDIPRGELIDYMIASASIYPAFKPHKIGGVRYLDGAYYDNLPVKMALEKGAGHIIAVDLEAFGVVKKEMMMLADRLTYIRSYWNLGPTLVFDQAVIRRNTRLGYLDGLKAFGVYEGCAFTFTPGFGRWEAKRLRRYLPLTGLLEKGSGGFVLDQLFLKQMDKIFQEHGVREPDEMGTALVCAETAGEIFGLDSETIYSCEEWQSCLRKRVEESMKPEKEENGKTDFTDILYESAKTLAGRRSRAVLAGRIIGDLIRNQKEQVPPAGFAILPEAFLAGVYLTASELV